MLLSRDAIFNENALGNSEHVKEKGINDHPLFTEKPETEDVVHFEGRDTETVNEGGQEHPTEVTTRKSQR